MRFKYVFIIDLYGFTKKILNIYPFLNGLDIKYIKI